VCVCVCVCVCVLCMCVCACVCVCVCVIDVHTLSTLLLPALLSPPTHACADTTTATRCQRSTRARRAIRARRTPLPPRYSREKLCAESSTRGLCHSKPSWLACPTPCLSCLRPSRPSTTCETGYTPSKPSLEGSNLLSKRSSSTASRLGSR
jgi:hypothetical protein